MLADPNFWVLVSFVIFISFSFAGATRAIKRVLDARVEKISLQLDEALRLKEEAQDLLNKQKKAYLEAVARSEQIISNAQEEARTLREENEKNLKNLMRQKERSMRERIANLEHQIMTEIRRGVSDVSINAVRSLLKEVWTPAMDSKMMEVFVKDLEKLPKVLSVGV